MATKQTRNHGLPFTTLVGNFPYGSDPSHYVPAFQNPPPNRQAHTYHVINTGHSAVHATNVNALLQGTPVGPQTAVLTVADNDFSTGAVILTLGDFTLTSNVDYVVGVDAATTAINLAAAIDALAGFTAVAVGTDVEIDYTVGPANVVDFSVAHLGTIENFTPLVPDTGVMAVGAPTIGPPDLA